MALVTFHATLHSEIRTGDCWINDTLTCRLIRLRNVSNGNSVVVAYRHIDANYINHYNVQGSGRIFLTNQSIVLDDYYRNILGVTTQQTVDIDIIPIGRYGFLANMEYLKHHANDVVRISFWLGFIAVIMGILPTIKYGGEYLEKLWECISKL